MSQQSIQQPTRIMIETMISEANLAPSGDNAQPWKFSWSHNELKIFHSVERAAHVLNRGNHTSLLALGTLIESIVISATQFGFIAQTQLHLEAEEKLPIWAVVRFAYKSVQTDPLFPMIRVRHTDRRPYMGGKMNPELWQKIQLIKNDFVGCRVRKLEKVDSTFMKYYLKAEEIMWTDVKVIRDLAKWIRLTNKETESSRDGMSWKNVGLNRAEAVLFRLIKRYPGIPKMLWSVGFGKRIKADAVKAINSSDALLCFTGDPQDLKSYCQIGRMAYRVWLLLNSYGHGVQPLTFSSTSIADAASGCMKENVHFFQNGLTIFKKSFALTDDETPLWMFRTGVAPSGFIAKTQRQEIDKLIIK